MEGISLEEGKLQIIINSAQLDQELPVISEIVTLQRRYDIGHQTANMASRS